MALIPLASWSRLTIEIETRNLGEALKCRTPLDSRVHDYQASASVDPEAHST